MFSISQSNANGDHLKNLMIDEGIPKKAIGYVIQKLPQASRWDFVRCCLKSRGRKKRDVLYYLYITIFVTAQAYIFLYICHFIAIKCV